MSRKLIENKAGVLKNKAGVLENNAGVLENNAGVLIKRRKESEPTWIRSLLLFIYIPLFMRTDSRWDRSHPSGSCSRSRPRGCPCTSEPPTGTYPGGRTSRRSGVGSASR